ncbi:MAG: FAD-dependent oxidoreductase [Deltaproteobacteria bacterium]|nr:FAD-dependent oxidoreductase [Deltaproteobacteria bacterium]MBW2111071.1 FAD-dependent oxidoreductase [Deltaproteobacteria bacterium]MBW2354688.1 FAD-dependent oxidoreductase [Deltaproteobacteria bacterium]HDZ89894.1 FAD-dependent oxidoreductase [Deltaproteobacteria bacterium]
MPEGFAITVVGAGVVGCALALELAREGEEVVVLEMNPGVSRGENQSSRNSGVIHAGLYYDQETRPLKAALCVKGNRILYRFCERYGVPALRTGKLVVATNREECSTLDRYLGRALENNVPVRMLNREQVREYEPRVRAEAALLLPSSGIVDPAALVHKLYALASSAGAQFVSETEVVGISSLTEGLEVKVRYRDGAEGSFSTGRLVNSAGLYCDRVARMVDPASPYRVDPLRGEAMKFYRTRRPELSMSGMNVYPTPRKVITDQGVYFTVGVHLTPTLDTDLQGNFSLGPVVTVGPLNRQARSRGDFGGGFQPVREFHKQVCGFFPGLREEDLEPHQAGIQSRLVANPDWVFEFSPADPRCLNLLGIDSPGLTGALAIARWVRTTMLG